MAKEVNYGLQTSVNMPFAATVSRVTEALKAEGFGILTEINMQATFKAKLDVEIADYVILGACNPKLAYQAFQQEQAIGLLLPCNVIVYTDKATESTHVAILEPTLMVQLTENPALDAVANEAHARLERVIQAL